MIERLTFDVYAEIADPPFRVEYEAYESRVSVMVGEPQSEVTPVSLLTLWFTDPETVLAWGRDLTSAGMRLAAQLGTRLPDRPDVDQVDTAEEYPVPSKKLNDVESDEHGEPGAKSEDDDAGQ